MHICIMGTMSIPHGQHEPGLSQKGRKEGGGAFLPKFQECLFFSIHSFYMDLSHCKIITKRCVM